MAVRVSRLPTIAMLALLPLANAATAAEAPALERWRSYTGVSWEMANGDQAPAKFHASVNAPIAGIHFDGQGTAFVSTPRLVSAQAPATLSTLDTRAQGGPARLSAFPSRQGNAVDGAAHTSLRNVLGFHVDRTNGWLWALDMGFVAGEAEAPSGSQKVMVLELKTGALVKTIPLQEVADRKASFLNDIVVDEGRRVAYISDSGSRSAPNNKVGLIVVDFVMATARRVLDRHPSLQVEPSVTVMAHGAEVWPGKPLRIGINGIALSPNGETLYWTVTTGTRLHALPTAILRQTSASEAQIAAAIRDLGAVGGNTDGLVTDARGRLYITDVTRNGIVRYDPVTNAILLLASDEGVHWPDTPAIHPDGDLVFTSSHLNDHFAGNVRAGEERFELWRLPLERRQVKAD